MKNTLLLLFCFSLTFCAWAQTKPSVAKPRLYILTIGVKEHKISRFNMKNRINPSDLFVLFFSGHGIENALIPYDYDEQDPERTIISRNYLTEKLEEMGCNSLILLDACHSGSFAKGKDVITSAQRQISADDAIRGLVESFSSTDKMRLILGSSASNKDSYECDECQNGYFAQGLIDAFDNLAFTDADGYAVKPDANNNGWLSPSEFSTYLQDAIKFRTAQASITDPRVQKQTVYKQEQTTTDAPFIFVGGNIPPPPPPPIPDDIDMVFVQGGTFLMGSNNGEADEKPIHSVTVSDFYIGKYEVTQKQWRAIMNTDPSGFKNCDDCPVEQVSYNGVTAFLEKLNQKTSKKYRLPTEAEWEYAARGGKKSNGYTYSGSNNIGRVAWYYDNNNKSTSTVGSKNANELGIYDMSGNIWEWCQDTWHSDYNGAPQNGSAWIGGDIGTDRVLRGGSWGNNATDCRVASRGSYGPNRRNTYGGFRLSLSVQ